jgi:hypothetical protein
MPVQIQQIEPPAPLVGEQLQPQIHLVDTDEPHRPNRLIVVERNRIERVIVVIEIYRRLLGTLQRPLNTRQAHALDLGDRPQAVAFGPKPSHLLVPVMHQAKPHSTMFAYGSKAGVSARRSCIGLKPIPSANSVAVVKSEVRSQLSINLSMP